MNNTLSNITIQAAVSGDNSDVADLGIAKGSVSKSIVSALTHGAAAGNANKWHADEFDVTGGSQVDLNLWTALDAVGVAMNIATLKVLIIENKSDAILTVGAAPNPIPLFGTPATDTIKIPVGGSLTWLGDGAGIAIATPGTCELRIAAAGAGNKQVHVIAVGVKP